MTKADQVHSGSQVEPVRENAHPVNRRKLLGEIAGGLVLGHAAVPALAGEAQDPHPGWWAEERRLWAAMEAAEGDDLVNRLNDQRWDVRELIITTPAATVAGMAVQIRLMSLYDDEGMEPYSDQYKMLERVADDLDRMAGRA